MVIITVASTTYHPFNSSNIIPFFNINIHLFVCLCVKKTLKKLSYNVIINYCVKVERNIMTKKIKFFNKMNIRILFLLIFLFFIAGISVTIFNYYRYKQIYEESFTEKVLLTNQLIASLIDDNDIQNYIDILNDLTVNDPEFIERQRQFNNDREHLYYLQENNGSIEEQDIYRKKMETFHQEMQAYKDDRYWICIKKIQELKETSKAKYVYIVADTNITDDEGNPLMTFIFDAEDSKDILYDNADIDGFGTVAYFEDIAFEIIETKQAMNSVIYYKSEPYGELYFAYAPIINDNGDVIAIVGTDLSLIDMKAQIASSVIISTIIFFSFVLATCMIIFFAINILIAKPVEQLAHTALDIADGNVYASIPANILEYTSELGYLAHAINDMSKAYQDMVKNTNSLFKAVNVGRLEVRNDPSKFKGDISKVIEQMNDTLDSFVLYLNSIPECLFIMNGDCSILFNNSHYAEKLFCMPASDFIKIVFPEAKTYSNFEIRQLLNDSLSNGTYNANVWIDKNCFSVIFKEIVLDADYENSILVIAIDITDLMKEKENAQSANNAKSEFLSRVSHELRTPMNIILGMTNLGLKDEASPKVHDRLLKIENASQHLLSIINDVLDMSKIEAGKMVIYNEAFNLYELINNCVNLFSQQALDKNIKSILNIDSSLPQTVIGDEKHLQQIILNLYSNAIKFTNNNGEIKVNVKLINNENDIILTEFSVSDSGIGMSEDFIHSIFSPFEQESLYLQRKYKGTGLGLTISKNLVELMNGTITVKSKQNEGSTFTCLIPLKKAAHSISKKNVHVQEQVDLSKLTILVADDIDLNRLILCELLADTGIHIVEAIDGLDAVKIFDDSLEYTFDLIFMDIQMPKIDGYEATKRIRNLNRSDSNVPIIAMTANALKQDIDRAAEYGMNSHMSKPIDYNICIEMIKRFHKKS